MDQAVSIGGGADRALLAAVVASGRTFELSDGHWVPDKEVPQELHMHAVPKDQSIHGIIQHVLLELGQGTCVSSTVHIAMQTINKPMKFILFEYVKIHFKQILFESITLHTDVEPSSKL